MRTEENKTNVFRILMNNPELLYDNSANPDFDINNVPKEDIAIFLSKSRKLFKDANILNRAYEMGIVSDIIIRKPSFIDEFDISILGEEDIKKIVSNQNKLAGNKQILKLVKDGKLSFDLVKEIIRIFPKAFNLIDLSKYNEQELIELAKVARRIYHANKIIKHLKTKQL